MLLCQWVDWLCELNQLWPSPLVQVCVAVFPDDGLWYRAEIISVPDENRVSVRYVDYGNTATVSRTTVRKAR